MRTIAFINQKGGVGKTTSCLSVGAGLAAAGKSVLLVDADPQGHLTKCAGIELDNDDLTLYEVLQGANINEAIKAGDYDVLPADIALSATDVELSSTKGKEYILKKALSEIRKTYDYILIDCPPALNTLTTMSLTATTELIIVVQAQYLAIDGVAQLLDTMRIVKQRLNPQLEICGVLLTFFDTRKNAHKELLESVTAAFPGKVFNTKISQNIKLEEAPSHGKDIFKYAPKCKGALQYAELVNEII